jgi:hypothetical protein
MRRERSRPLWIECAQSNETLAPLLSRGHAKGAAAARVAASAGVHPLVRPAVSRPAGVHAVLAHRHPGNDHLRRRRPIIRRARGVPARGGGLPNGRARGPADAQLPAVSGGGVRVSQGRPRDGEHQSALYAGGDGASVHGQRGDRSHRDRPLRGQGRPGVAPDVHPDGRGRGCGGSSAAGQAVRRTCRPEVRQADDSANHVRVRDVSRCPRPGSRAHDRSGDGGTVRGDTRSRHDCRAPVHGRDDRCRQGRHPHARQSAVERDAGARGVAAAHPAAQRSDADGIAALSHLRVHREPDDLLCRGRTEHPGAQPAPAVEPA